MTSLAGGFRVACLYRKRITNRSWVIESWKIHELQARRRAARLTAPAIPAQNLLPKILVRLGIKTSRAGSWPNAIHDAFSLRFLQERLLLVFWQKPEESHRKQQGLRVPLSPSSLPRESRHKSPRCNKYACLPSGKRISRP